jgi:dsDNA-binding SOS-regulon protein
MSGDEADVFVTMRDEADVFVTMRDEADMLVAWLLSIHCTQ